MEALSFSIGIMKKKIPQRAIRFSGQTIRIIVREGKIIEKIFVSPKGNKISVKRSKLELRIRSIPTIQIKLRLRIRSMPIIQRNLGFIYMKGI